MSLYKVNVISICVPNYRSSERETRSRETPSNVAKRLGSNAQRTANELRDIRAFWGGKPKTLLADLRIARNSEN